jgi:hypothetical protein
MTFTFDQLSQIAKERREWAVQAREKDLHGSAKEWELTAALAEELMASREQFGAVADSRFLTPKPR